MNKTRKLSLVAALMAVVMLMTACTAFADETLTDYKSETMTFSFGGGEFYSIGDISGMPAYCSTPSLTDKSVVFMVKEQDLGMDVDSLGDTMRKTMYDTMVKTLGSSLGNGDIATEEVTAAGVPAVKFTLKQNNIPVYGLLVLKGTGMLIVVYMGANITDGDARIAAICDTMAAVK